ncbi:MAG TPA: nitroreductase family deazaflavin-dependent oxidoreductase [Solirubrobacteraceae bacterium]|jgi:deazaflavin-dependent oxidoreductase (nitroreductase family)|nr:nitroreductase family deazaflavin-dependent oxidoreductase [Solirubrobacteraceae bacterium]
MAEMSDFNRKVIEEFRANDGKVGGPFEGAPVLLLTSTGARSGEQRTTPVVYQPDGDRMVIFASKAGAPENPAWYHNLRANSTATVEVGSQKVEVEAVITDGEERERLFSKQKQLMPQFADYEQKTSRQIPVVALQPKG